MQLRAIEVRFTAGQRRRREERIARRRQAFQPLEVSIVRPRERFMDRIKRLGRAIVLGERQANREKAQALAGQVARNKAALVMRSALTDRCAFQHVRTERTRLGVQQMVGDPCGGKLRPHRRQRPGEPRELQCSLCGRVYRDERAVAV